MVCIENEEWDLVRLLGANFHSLLPEWEGDTSNFLVRIGMPLDIYHMWGFRWEYFEEFADALQRGVRDILLALNDPLRVLLLVYLGM
jgi:hypothetical protein